jgi:hypothetical protein
MKSFALVEHQETSRISSILHLLGDEQERRIANGERKEP